MSSNNESSWTSWVGGALVGVGAPCWAVGSFVYKSVVDAKNDSLVGIAVVALGLKRIGVTATTVGLAVTVVPPLVKALSDSQKPKYLQRSEQRSNESLLYSLFRSIFG